MTTRLLGVGTIVPPPRPGNYYKLHIVSGTVILDCFSYYWYHAVGIDFRVVWMNADRNGLYDVKIVFDEHQHKPITVPKKKWKCFDTKNH